nr:Holliday junction resolvase RuvX [Saprospiraceae bacterium]
MGRILAIDYGGKRSGIAVTDSLQIAAHGLAAVATTELIDFLIVYLSEEKVDKIIVGLPHHPDGNPSSNAGEIERFAKNLRKKVKVEVELFDESYTSRDARGIILGSGAGKKKRRDKSLVDKVAAILILQRYLNHI